MHDHVVFQFSFIIQLQFRQFEISCLIDYIPDKQTGLSFSKIFIIYKIQRVQNAAARLIFEQPKFCHITPVLSQLHWLPIKYRIEFKILLMTFRRKSTGYSLRSSKKVMLEVPSGKILPTLGGRAFCYAAPKLWNNLPSEISSLDSLSNFKCHVKTYVFKQAFNL